MGSPALDLKLSEHLRPWRDAGLLHVLALPSLEQEPLLAGVKAGHDEAKREELASFEWPSPWDVYWSKTCQGARVALTYYELGFDLSGSPDARRRQLFREIIKHLGWAKKGIVSFWPMAALNGTTLVPDPEMFWAGISKLGIKHVACFGNSAASIITPQAQMDQDLVLESGITVHFLESPTEFLEFLPHELHLATDKLRSIRTS